MAGGGGGGGGRAVVGEEATLDFTVSDGSRTRE